MIPFSILDLSPITEGSTPAQSFRNSRDLAIHAEKLGYNRYWLAEHHGMPGIASAATSVVIGYIAEATSTIRVGAGGIMLPNHAPLAIVEQFGTLESLYPGRIDLGLGRAPGSDSRATRALRRTLASSSDEFPQDVLELLDFFSKECRQPLRAIPGDGLEVPVWILGSSLYGAQVAAAFGLPYAFASHFAPSQMMQAIEMYRTRFEPSRYLDKPYVMLGFNAFAADTDEEAHVLATSAQISSIRMRSGKPGQLPPPVPGYMERASQQEIALLDDKFACAAIGNQETVVAQLRAFIQHTGADELMIASSIFDHAARKHSYEIVANAHAILSQEKPQSAPCDFL